MSVKAKRMIIDAYGDKLRKLDEIYAFIHSLVAGMILEENNYSYEEIVAAYLHDAIEDGYLTYEDIKDEFGPKIANIVREVTVPKDFSSWNEKKEYTIASIDKMSDAAVNVKLAEKISTLQFDTIKWLTTGIKKIPSETEEKQKWYYEELLKKFIARKGENDPLVQKLKHYIDIFFENRKVLFLKGMTLATSAIKSYRHIASYAQRVKLQALKKVSSGVDPYIVRLNGSQKLNEHDKILGKNTALEMHKFFNDGKLKTRLIESPVVLDEDFLSSVAFEDLVLINSSIDITKSRFQPLSVPTTFGSVDIIMAKLIERYLDSFRDEGFKTNKYRERSI